MNYANITTEQTNAMGIAIFIKEAAKLGWEIFTPIMDGTRTDFLLIDPLCKNVYSIQLKSTQGEIIKTLGRQGPKRHSKDRNPPVEYHQDFIVGVNVVNETIKWFPKNFYRKRKGSINMRTMSQYAAIPPKPEREINRIKRPTLDNIP